MANVEQIVKSLLQDGVTIVEDVLTDDQCRQTLDGIDWAVRTQEGPLPLQRQRTYEYFKEHPIFVELIEHPLAIAVADACLGPNYHLICAEITRNEQNNHFLEAVKDIHQDHCFFPDDSRALQDMKLRMYGFTAQWVAHDIPPEMGPTEFIVGSHVSPRRYLNEEAPSCINFRNHFPKGSLVLYDHRAWHRGTNNHAATPRDLTQNCYALHAIDKVQIVTKHENGSSSYVPCTELLETGTDTIRKLLTSL